MYGACSVSVQVGNEQHATMPFTGLLQSDLDPRWQPLSQQQYQQYSMAQARNPTWFPTRQQQQQLQLEQQQQQLQPKQRHQELHSARVLHPLLESYQHNQESTTSASYSGSSNSNCNSAACRCKQFSSSKLSCKSSGSSIKLRCKSSASCNAAEGEEGVQQEVTQADNGRSQ